MIGPRCGQLNRPGNEAPISSAIADPIIEFREVTYSVKGRTTPLISQLSMEVNSGETLVLLGRSGSGKTTLLRLINRMLAPSNGQVVVEGKATVDWDAIRLRRHIGAIHRDVAAVVEVAQRAGFGDDERMRRAFMRHLGISPSEYRSRFAG